MTVTSELAAALVRRPWDQLPADQIAQMKRFVLDYLGVAVSGAHTESGRIAQQFVTELGGAPQATLIGSGAQVPAVHAAFANAISEHSIELDDVDEEALFHYGPPILSTALAVGQWRHATGKEFLRAVLAGAETLSRISRATNNALRDRGFHTTAVCGVFGSAVTAGLLLGLDEAGLTNALGLAGAQASGLMEMYGPSMQKRFNPGPAARNGVTAAQLAALGFTGADTILDGERGFGPAFAGRFDRDRFLEGLGQFVPVIVEHKPYSAARPIHNAIDCALQIRARSSKQASEIVDILVKRHPDWAHYHLNSAPKTFHEAQVSLPYSVAAAFVLGAALPEQYGDEYLTRDDLRALTAKVRIEPDPTQARGVSCDMTVTYADGTTERVVVDYPKGSVQNPMTEEDLERKFRSLAGPHLSSQTQDAIIEAVRSLENLDDIGSLVTLLVRDTAVKA
jgi:2-methylcitrate dehydratase PrpD